MIILYVIIKQKLDVQMTTKDLSDFPIPERPSKNLSFEEAFKLVKEKYIDLFKRLAKN